MLRSETRLGFVAVALVVGIMVALSLPGMATAWPVLAVLAVVILALGYGYAVRFWPVVFFFVLGLTLTLREQQMRARVLMAVDFRGGFCEGAFCVKGEAHVGRRDDAGMRWVSFPTTFNDRRLNVVFSQSEDEAVPQVGETWNCAGWLDRRKDAASYARNLWVKGRRSYARHDATVPREPFVAALALAKKNLSHRLGLGLEDRPLVANIHRAMLLGERASLPFDTRQDMVRSGTMHVFAISGLHVAVVTEIFLYALVLLSFPVRWAGVVLLPVLWLYVLLIGASPSAVRAAAMASIYYAAPIFWRRPNSLTAWEVTLIVFALLDPIGLFGVGSLLSFSVVLGILLFLRWAKPFGAWWVKTFGLPVAAWTAGVPIVAHVFARITPGGLFSNLLEIPLAGGIVLTSALGVAVSFVSEALAARINNLAGLFTEVMIGVSSVVAHIPGADITIVPWTRTMGVLWYAGVILTFVWVKMVWMRRRRSLA